jgi:aspartyl-tRNA(Asn)/glutamyl-tRNA(Gln) amidotransferase subunit A
MIAGIDDATLFLSVGELSRLVRTKQISPVELANAYLARLEQIGPRLNAVVTVTRERALAEARAAEKEIAAGRHRGPLHGIPYGVKDLLATKGIPTTWGAEPYRNQVFDYDSTVVSRLQQAGGVLVAKLAMIELAGGLGYNSPDASFTGPCKTPWNTGYWSGGSSSGPGSATAAGLVAFAIGSETSGSILNPSGSCGLSGLRPTYGRVSRHGAMALSWTLDKLGPMCRAADDCGLVLAAIAGHDPLDPTSASRRFVYPAPVRGANRKYRLGVPKGVTENGLPEVRANFAAALKALEPVAEIVHDVDLPSFPQVTGPIISAEGAAAFRDLIVSGRAKQLRNQNDRVGGDSMMMTLAVDYIDALRIRRKMIDAWVPVWKKFDALIAPNGSVAPPIEGDFDRLFAGARGGGREGGRPAGPPPGVSLVPTGNALGVPALALMNGFGPHGLPTSMQVMGGPFSEARLIAIGRDYQKATDWHRKHPTLTEQPTTPPAAEPFDLYERL